MTQMSYMNSLDKKQSEYTVVAIRKYSRVNARMLIDIALHLRNNAFKFAQPQNKFQNFNP